ncbi:MAG: type II toxin-antitoxin system YafQ family toxin [Candidatus Ornithomonoglobus sp.]
MKYELILSNRFKKSLKRCKKRGLDINLLQAVVDKLQNGEPLETKYHDHSLKGSLSDFRECHIQPDWLLIYLIENNILTLTLVDTGSHSDLFDI